MYWANNRGKKRNLRIIKGHRDEPSEHFQKPTLTMYNIISLTSEK